MRLRTSSGRFVAVRPRASIVRRGTSFSNELGMGFQQVLLTLDPEVENAFPGPKAWPRPAIFKGTPPTAEIIPPSYGPARLFALAAGRVIGSVRVEGDEESLTVPVMDGAIGGAGAIALTMLRPDGSPWVGRLEVRRVSWSLRWMRFLAGPVLYGRTDEEGRFEVAGVRKGRWLVGVSVGLGGETWPVLAESVDVARDLLEDTGRMKERVVSVNEPLEFGGVPAGRWRVRLEVAGLRSVEGTVEVAPGDTAEGAWVLERGIAMAAVLEAPGSTLGSRAKVRVVDPGNGTDVFQANLEWVGHEMFGALLADRPASEMEVDFLLDGRVVARHRLVPRSGTAVRLRAREG